MITTSNARYRATSWSGSESQRREQGICLPPQRESKIVPRFLIVPDTKCAVTALARVHWRAHVTRTELSFENYERAREIEGEVYYEFRVDGAWLLLVRQADVQHRNASDRMAKVRQEWPRRRSSKKQRKENRRK